MEPVHKSNVLGTSSQALCENPGYILASSPAFEIIPLWHSVGIVSFHLRKTMERENHLVHRKNHLVIRKHLRQAAKTGPRLNIPKPSLSTAWSQLNRGNFLPASRGSWWETRGWRGHYARSGQYSLGLVYLGFLHTSASFAD